MSNKSKLNEYCQKQRTQALYSCTWEGPPHKRLFTATVSIDKLSLGFSGQPCATKKKAEESAASRTLIAIFGGERTQETQQGADKPKKEDFSMCYICRAQSTTICLSCLRKVCSPCMVGCNVCDSEPHCAECVDFHYYGE